MPEQLTFGWVEDGTNSGFFAKHFIKESQSQRSSEISNDDQDIGKLTTAIIDFEKNVPVKEQILKFFEKVDLVITRWFKHKRYCQN